MRLCGNFPVLKDSSGPNTTRLWFSNFLAFPLIFGGHLWFYMRLWAKVLDTSGISNTNLQISYFGICSSSSMVRSNRCSNILETVCTHRKIRQIRWIDSKTVPYPCWCVSNIIISHLAGTVTKVLSYWIFHRYPICPGVNRFYKSMASALKIPLSKS